jgi:hypothetical protein
MLKIFMMSFRPQENTFLYLTEAFQLEEGEQPHLNSGVALHQQELWLNLSNGFERAATTLYVRIATMILVTYHGRGIYWRVAISKKVVFYSILA